jgi:hypothetical protein
VNNPSLTSTKKSSSAFTHGAKQKINSIEILKTGTFGVKVYKRRGLLKNLTKSLIAMGSKEAYNEDQKLLFKVFWPSVKEDAVSHSLGRPGHWFRSK